MLFLLVSPAFCHAQGFDCNFDYADPTLATVSPSTWQAGKANNITLTGTNFCAFPGYGVADNVWVYPPGQAYGSDGFTSATNIVVVSSSEITATITPDASMVGDATIVVSYVDGGMPTTLPIQIVGGLNITSVTPPAWWAGQKPDTKITINGTNFLTKSKLGGPSQVTLSDSANLTLNNVNVVSSTQITATVDVAKKTPNETVTLTVTNPATNGGTAQTATASPAPVVLPVPIIQWLGKTISGNNAKTQSVIAGQPVELTTTPATLVGGYTISKSTWNIDGTTIKTYHGDSSGITLQKTDLDTQNTTFYWLYQDDLDGPHNVTYEYCATDPIGNQLCASPQAKATFKVKGPDSSNALSVWDSDQASIEHLEICDENGNIDKKAGKETDMGYGDVSGPGPTCPLSLQQTGTPGIKLIASGASGGKYVFVQLIDSDSRTYTSSAGSYTCTKSANLDKHFPYLPYKDEPNVAPDGPEIPLPSSYKDANRDFHATMYLLWQPDKLSGASANPIPVPIGYQKWQFKAATEQKSPVGGGQWKNPSLELHGTDGSYQPSQQSDNALFGYPVFNDVSAEVCP
jgi:hypothetical protein